MSKKDLPRRRFQRKIEDFQCANCACRAKGTGFTNHCPKCLYSKHVDINPGDRAESCRGLMRPVDLEQKHGQIVLIHRCEKCGAKRRVKIDKDDDYQEVLRIAELKK